MYCQYFKRVFDVIISTVLLLLSLPLLLSTLICVRWFFGSPILFRQVRAGKNGRPFILYKFRTMRTTKNSRGELLSDAERLTIFGKFLRSLSIDELPGLVNVLKGEMSLIGPRPLLLEYLPHYSKTQRTRHDIKPGITGWAQVNGRNTLSWERKFEYDVWYVQNCSFTLDCKILFLSIIKVLSRQGIQAPGHATMARFDEEVLKNNKQG